MEYILDLEGVEDMEELHGLLSDIFELPKYYGKNLDGFYDVMSSRSNDMKIILINAEKEDERMCAYIEKLKRVLTDLENECENIFVDL